MSAADSLILSTRELAGLIEDVVYLAEGTENTRKSNTIGLGQHAVVYGIAAAYKNGSSITDGSGYTWKTYRPNVVLSSTPAANDHFLFRVKTGLSDTSIQEHLDKARDEVYGALRGFYETAESIDTQPSFLEIVRDLAAGRLIQLRTAGVALENARYRAGVEMEKNAKERIKAIKNGTAELLDADDAVVTRKVGSVVGGFINSNGALAERGDWWTRLKDYQSTTERPEGQTDT